MASSGYLGGDPAYDGDAPIRYPKTLLALVRSSRRKPCHDRCSPGGKEPAEHSAIQWSLPNRLDTDGELPAVILGNSAQLDDDDMHDVGKNEGVRCRWPARPARCPRAKSASQSSSVRARSSSRTAASWDTDDAVRYVPVKMLAIGVSAARGPTEIGRAHV